MRLTLCAIGSWGDVGPFISLGRALVAQGADVVFAAPPEFLEAALDASLEFRPIAPTCGSLIAAASAATGAPLRSLPLLLRATRVLTDETLAELPAIAGGSQALVATGIAYAAPHVAEALRIPYRAVAVCPRWYPSEHHPPASDTASRRSRPVNSASWWATEQLTDVILSRVVNDWRRRQRLPSAARLYGRMIGLPGERILAADEELAAVPSDVVGARQVCAVEPFQADALPADVEDFLAAGSPPVYVGFGSMNTTDAGRLLGVVLESAAALNIRTIVPRTWASASGGRVPAGCLAVERVPFRLMFPRVAAVVHHGGAGTTTTAARAGVPQVVVPHVMDQFYWGRRVHDLGIGPEPLVRGRLSQRTLTSALGQTLGSSSMVEAARMLGANLVGGEGAAQLATLLLNELR